ncbi:MAG: LCP family protein [Ornithinimicrobium sp.]|uniref:LCP family protein n=1 Tax=Ornithinimicrobium sp. TaxID=1977084 RepID=UPI003D9B3385
MPRTVVVTLIASLTTVTACSSEDRAAAPTEGESQATESPAAADSATETQALMGDVAARTTAAPSAAADSSPTTGRPSASAAASSPTSTAVAAPAVDTDAVPAPLAGLAEGLYAEGQVSMSDAVRRALGERTVADLAARVEVAGATGEWKGTGIAVLTSGEDVTLAVEADGGWQIVGGWWPSLGVDQPVLGGARHMLFLGSDARPGEAVDRARADTIQVVGVDGRGGGGVMGIARDSWVTMPSGGKAKINAAMVEAGPAGQQSTVAAATGLPIEGYLLTSFEGLTGLVNGLGGVPVDAPRRVLQVPAGNSVLDGKTALRYSRERKTVPGGDFGRSRHQGVVLLGMAAMAREQGPKGLPAILSTASPHVLSNVSAAQALTFGANAYVVSPGQVGTSVAKGGFGWSDDGQSIVLLDGAAYDDFADFADGNLD